LGEEMGVASYLINDANDIDLSWFDNVENIGITAGASAPEVLIEDIIAYLQKRKEISVVTMDGDAENVVFKLPLEVI
jgi:4-hydroxy-3-methylbut-2-enyl diphosphate reductase